MSKQDYYRVDWRLCSGKFQPSAFLTSDVDFDEMKQLVKKHSPKLSELKWHIVSLYAAKGELRDKTDLSDIKNIWPDYMLNQKALPIMSEKMKAIIETHLKGPEGVFWIPIHIEGNGEERIYYLLRFKEMINTLNMEQSFPEEFKDRGYGFARYDRKKTFKYAILSDRGPFWWSSNAFTVNDEIRRHINREKLTGVKFDPVTFAD